MLRIEQITKIYLAGATKIVALDGVSVNFRRSEFVSILGPSGCGKTTLLNIIGGLDRYTKGDLFIDGKSTKDFSARDWDAYRNHCIGYVFQNYHLIPHLSILQNVELALTIGGESKTIRHIKAIEALQKVGLGDQIDKKPNQLSGGQMQRVAIARALVSDPQIILADEPTGALDSKTSVQILDLLKEVAKDRLVIMVTHNTELAEKYSTRIVSLLDGHITSDTQPLEGAELEEIKREERLREQSIWEEKSSEAARRHRDEKMQKHAKVSPAAGGEGEQKQAQNSTGTGADSKQQTNADSKQQTNADNQQQDSEINQQQANLANLQQQDYADSKQQDNSSNQQQNYADNQQQTKSSNQQQANADNQQQANTHKAEKKTSKKTGMKGTSMSFFTALSLSFKNLLSKKGRSVLVSFAGSIGIIGIALVLSISNGFTQYINTSETQMLSNYPVTISRSGLSLEAASETSMELVEEMGNLEEFPDTDKISFFTPPSMSSFLKTNRITKEFVEYVEQLKTMESKSSEVRGLSPVLDVKKSYLFDMPLLTMGKNASTGKDEAIRIKEERNQMSQMAEIMGISNSNALFMEIVDNPEFFQSQYDLLSGKYPTQSNEIALIVDTNNRLRATLAESLGLDTSNELKFSSIIGKTYKIINNDAFYQTEGTSIIEIDEESSGKAAKYKALFDSEREGDSIELKISGILRINPDVALDMYGTGLVYLPTLTQDFIAANMNSTVANLQRDALDETKMGGITKMRVYKAAMQPDQNNIYANVMKLVTEFESNPGDSQMMGIWEENAELIRPIQQELIQMLLALPAAAEDYADEEKDSFGFPMYYFAQRMMQISSGELTSIEEMKIPLLQKLCGSDLPDKISIYPRSFETKKEIVEHLDKWNAAHPENKIAYSDPSNLFKVFGDIIDIISYVLIAFSAVSLIVSSIMIGIITYVSVIERTKEIGILRSVGASKQNVANVFNAETIILGFFAGLIGVVVTYVLCIPINAIIALLAGDVLTTSLAILNPLHALILVAVSTCLTLVSGLIPSSMAANQDPVKALRSE
jgi:ABC-type lipoprotein export system ATPase subunit/ABC-type lipoprotein release transport system permease subunit